MKKLLLLTTWSLWFTCLFSQSNIPTSGNQSITTCSTTIYDMGGSGSGLTPNADGSITIYPGTAGNVVAVMVQQLDIDWYTDYLYIYDGANTSGTLLKTFQGGWGSTQSVDYREYYGTSGAITIRLKTGPYASSSNAGCMIRVRCAPTTQQNNLVQNRLRVVNSCNTTIYDNGGLYGDYANNSKDTLLVLPDAPNKIVQLTYQHHALNDINGYDQIYYLGGLRTSPSSTLFAHTGYALPNSGNPGYSPRADGSVSFIMETDAAYMAQGFRILVSCSTATTTALTETIVPISGNANITTCGAKVYDNGHKYNYFPNSNGTLAITPATAGKKVKISFAEFNITAGDALYVYDGPSVSGTLLGTYTGTTLPEDITATSANSSGALTVKFTSNGSSESTGFIFNTSCVDPLPETLIPATGSTSLTTCDQTILDNGGVVANYAANSNGTLVLTPGTAGTKMKLHFNSFSTEATNDYLSIYDGNSATAALIGTYSGTSIPADIVATNIAGQLFLKFVSNATTNAAGFSINASCVVPEVKISQTGSNNFILCNSYVFDDGGEFGNYSSDADGSVTIYPESAGQYTNIDFLSFSLDNFDTLYVYDGELLTNLLGKFTGATLPPSLRASSSNTSRALTIRLASNSSVSSTGFKALISCGPAVTGSTIPAYGNNVVTTCNATVYDASGSNNNYGNNLDGSTTFYPAAAGNVIRATFNSFDTESGSDILYVYDGTSTSAPLIGQYSGTSLPPTLTAYNASGALTIRFKSNASSSSSGFSVTLSCVVPQVVVPASGSVSITTCGKTIYDSGESTGNYGINQDGYITIYPETPGAKVKINFVSFNTESGYDYLYIYDGVNTSAASMGSFSGTTIPPSKTATNASGAITIRFKSDDSVVKSGFEITVSCIVNVSSIQLDPVSVTMIPGDNVTITPTVNPSNATNNNIIWSSSNNSVATVTNGVIAAVAQGSAIITAKTVDGNFTATTSVTVVSPQVTGVTVSPDNVSIIKGKTTNFVATIIPQVAINKNVTWTSSDNTIATVDARGLVTGIEVGNAVITVTTEDGGFTATSNVTVTPIVVTGITVDQVSTSLMNGTTVQLTATLDPANAADKNVTWTSSDDNVATVDANGLVTAMGEGNAIITVTTEDGGFTATSNIVVTPIVVTGIAIDPVNTSIMNGTTVQLTATLAPANAVNKNVTWISSDENIATVDANGLVTGVGVGNAIITVTTEDGGFTATSNIAVTPVVVTGITIDPVNTSIMNGTTIQLSETISPADAANKNVTWTSSDENIATVDANGLVTGIGVGSAIITVTTEDGGYTATSNIEVTPIFVTGISIDPVNSSIMNGTTIQLSATIAPTNAVNKNVTWSSSNGSVATVDANGLLTGAGVGTSLITVTSADGGFTSSFTITVTPVVVTGITVNPVSISVMKGRTILLTPTIYPDNATNKNVTWSSSDNTIATVDENGLVTGVGAGSVEIKATTLDGGYTTTTNVTVESVNSTLDASGSQKLIAYPNPSNGIIKICNALPDTQADVLDMNGTKLLSVHLDGNGQLDISELGCGVYSLLLKVEGKTSVVKIVISK